MRIVCLSDTHSFNASIGARIDQGEQPPVDFVPDGDVLIHAGDLTDSGTPDQVYSAYAWLSKMPHERIIVTPGNHDFAFERTPQIRNVLKEKFPRVETLIDEETIVGGLRLWASPWTPWFHDWAYNFLPGPAGEEMAEEAWSMIPDDTAILVTHGPPYGILDKTLRGRLVGDSTLKARIAQLKDLRLHVFGHIHECHGTARVGDVLHVNACTCDHLYDPVQKPLVLDWNGERFEVVR